MKSLYNVISESILDDDYVDKTIENVGVNIVKSCLYNGGSPKWDDKKRTLTTKSGALRIILDDNTPVLNNPSGPEQDIHILDNINVVCYILSIDAAVINNTNLKLSDLHITGTKGSVLIISQQIDKINPVALTKFIDCDAKFNELHLHTDVPYNPDMDSMLSVLQSNAVAKFDGVRIDISQGGRYIDKKDVEKFFAVKGIKAKRVYVGDAVPLFDGNTGQLKDKLKPTMSYNKPDYAAKVMTLLQNNPKTTFLFNTSTRPEIVKISNGGLVITPTTYSKWTTA